MLLNTSVLNFFLALSKVFILHLKSFSIKFKILVCSKHFVYCRKYGKDFTPKMHNYTLSNRAYWPGTSDNVINQSDDGKSNSLFHHTGANRRNHGNVVKCTWPMGDHKLIYGDITRGRSYQVGWNDL